MAVRLKTIEEVNIMREGGKILASILNSLCKVVTVGVSSATIDQFVYDEIIKANAKPSFLGYRGYKHSTCISKNEEVVHGIPYANKKMLPGDICSVDVGVFYKGFHVDAARTFLIDEVTDEARRLVEVTECSFFEAIKEATPGKALGDIANRLQLYVETNKFSVIRDLYSHGVGKELHEDPLVPNYGKKGSGLKLKAGMTIALEPMVSVGSFEVLTLEDKWTIITADRKLAAHYENTIYIGPDGVEILTI